MLHLPDLVVQIFFGVFVLGGCVAYGCVRWIRLVPSPALVQRIETAEVPPVTAFARVVLIVTAVVLLPWAFALFVTDDGPGRLIWAWPGDLLTSRLIAVMLLTAGTASLASLRSGERARLVLAMNVTYGAGVVAAGLANAWFGKPPPVGYRLVLGGVAVASIAALNWSIRRANEPS